MYLYAVVWQSVGEEPVVKSRHCTLGAAVREAHKSQVQFKSHQGGDALCAYDVMALVGGEVTALSDDDYWQAEGMEKTLNETS